MSRLQQARDQILFARRYTLNLLEDIDTADWFKMPKGSVSHVGWQVGHLAMAQYRLCMERIRGNRPEDAELISEHFLKIFGKESVPEPDAGYYPDAVNIRRVFDRVHKQLMDELSQMDEAELDAPVLKPHKLIKTKHWALIWCSHHEFLHAGQIGLLRRMMGAPPIW